MAGVKHDDPDVYALTLGCSQLRLLIWLILLKVCVDSCHVTIRWSCLFACDRLLAYSLTVAVTSLVVRYRVRGAQYCTISGNNIPSLEIT